MIKNRSLLKLLFWSKIEQNTLFVMWLYFLLRETLKHFIKDYRQIWVFLLYKDFMILRSNEDNHLKIKKFFSLNPKIK